MNTKNKVNPPVIDILHLKGGLIYAFSLIELSIVLIIIGLLVAGVTGGKSLIESARSRALINELREYERAVWTFRAARDRWPGDVANLGSFGFYSNYDDYIEPYYFYKETDFPSDFIADFKESSGGDIPDYYSAPFVDLYTEGLIGFKPLGNSETSDTDDYSGKGTPNSKVINPNSVILSFDYTKVASEYSGTPDATSSGYRNGLNNFGNMNEVIGYWDQSGQMDPKLLKQVDLKLDDGEHWNGKMRSYCYGSGYAGSNTYENAIENNEKCEIFKYAL